MVIYASTEIGCALREARSLDACRRMIQREIGSLNHISAVRVATIEDVDWVRRMGGFVPEAALRKLESHQQVHP